MQFLKIENIGVCPVEGFTIFGASSKHETTNNKIIGTFGSGAKHGVSLALRQGLMPIVYCGKVRLAFYTKPLVIKGVAGESTHQRLCVKVNGQAEDGKTLNQDRDLDHTLSYGTKDWAELALALREFVSNAIDACYEQGLDHKSISVELVEDAQVRAKAGTTRIFIPANIDVMKFYYEINKWFLHFEESESMNKKILLKSNRNTISKDGVKTQSAVIYRRGVRVREFMSSSLSSLFDYNIPDLPIDESRTIDDWKARFECGQALTITDDSNVPTAIFKALLNMENYWELEQDSFALTYNNSTLITPKHKVLWKTAFNNVCGSKAVVTTEHLADRVAEKGYYPIVLSSSQNGMLTFLKNIGITSDTDVLTINDLHNRKVLPPTKAVIDTLNWVWSKLEKVDLCYNRAKPEVRCFKQMTEASTITMGYWLEGIVYINHDFSQNSTDALNDIMIEEVAHHVTKACDGSRDFANFLIRLASELAKQTDKV